MSLAVASTNAVFSRIQEVRLPKTRTLVPPSVDPEPALPASPFSISSIQRAQCAMASGWDDGALSGGTG